MQLHSVTERTLDLIIKVAKGATLDEAAVEFKISRERIRQIVMKFFRLYLEHARQEGTPEMFYPGPDKEYGSYFGDAVCDSENWCDFTTFNRYINRLFKKGLVYEDVANTTPGFCIYGLEELRE